MKTHPNWARPLAVVGLLATFIGCVDPLEGWIAILAGIGVVALAAASSSSRWLKLLVVAFALTAVGVAAMLVLSFLGGIGGASGRSLWWAFALVPYPAGFLLGLVGAVLLSIEVFRTRRLQPPAAKPSV